MADTPAMTAPTAATHAPTHAHAPVPGADRPQPDATGLDGLGPEARLVVIGCGYSASAFLALSVAAGLGGAVATTRHAGRFAEIRALGAEPIAFDGSAPVPALAEAIRRATHLVVSAPPDGEGDPLLRQHADDIAAAKDLAWIGYYSTIGVYGDHDGGWIDESAPLAATSERGGRRIETEADWLGLGGRIGVPVTVLRLAGIYGPGRNGLKNLAEGTAKRVIKPGQVFNRIHVDDIAAATQLAAVQRAGGMFNLCDDEPAPPQDVVSYAAGLMGIAPPPEVPFDEAEMTPMARSFYSDNKRVSNRAVKEKLGFTFRYPTYRPALDDLWTSGRWRG